MKQILFLFCSVSCLYSSDFTKVKLVDISYVPESLCKKYNCNKNEAYKQKQRGFSQDQIIAWNGTGLNTFERRQYKTLKQREAELVNFINSKLK